MRIVAFLLILCLLLTYVGCSTLSVSKDMPLFLVVLGDKNGYINKTGKIVIKPQFDFAGEFSEGLAPVVVGYKWGYMDKTEQIVIEPQFFNACSFSAGLALVQVLRNQIMEWGYIDKTGHYV